MAEQCSSAVGASCRAQEQDVSWWVLATHRLNELTTNLASGMSAVHFWPIHPSLNGDLFHSISAEVISIWHRLPEWAFFMIFRSQVTSICIIFK